MNDVEAKLWTNLSFSVKVVTGICQILLFCFNLIFEFVMSGSGAIMLAQNREFCLPPLQPSILESRR